MTKKQRLSILFEKWQRKLGTDYLVDDGIVDESSFEETKPRILYLLKEPNDNGGKKSWSLTEYIRKVTLKEKGYSPGQFCGTLARWSYGLLNGYPCWHTIETLKQGSMLNILNKIAILNIKKTGGTGSADEKEIKTHLHAHKEEILEEIRIVAPEIVICCGVGHLWMQEFPNNVTVHNSPTGLQWFEFALAQEFSPRKFLCFAHPSRPMEKAIMYSYYLDGIRSDETLRKGFCIPPR